MLNSYILLGALQSFLQQRDVQVERLTADRMVPLMIDWFRLVPVDTLERTSTADVLVYRYGGWSEGCATAFKLSLLRRVTVRDASGADDERLAGITMMFEPSAQAELMPFSAVASDANSIGVFVTAVESSPAFQLLAGATPMGVMVESGGVR